MMNYKRVNNIAMCVILAFIVVVTIAIWQVSVPRELAFGHIRSWQELPVNQPRLSQWVFVGEAYAKGVTRSRYVDDIYITGRALPDTIENYANNQEKGVLFSKISNPGLGTDLLKAVSVLEIKPEVVSKLSGENAWTLIVFLGIHDYIHARYDPDTQIFLAYVGASHRWKQRK